MRIHHAQRQIFLRIGSQSRPQHGLPGKFTMSGDGSDGRIEPPPPHSRMISGLFRRVRQTLTWPAEQDFELRQRRDFSHSISRNYNASLCFN